jgi:hypothetical protein
MALNIPLPKIVPDVGPGGGAFDVYNRLREAALRNRRQELENQYYGPTAEANALSKIAYSQFVGPEAISKLLNAPNAAANMSPEQYRALVQRAQQMASNPPDIRVPHAENEPTGIAGWLMKLALDKMQRREAQQERQQVKNALLQNPVAPRDQEYGGAQNKMSDEEVEQFTNNLMKNIPQEEVPSQNALLYSNKLPSTTVGRLAENAQVPGTMGAQNPQVLNKAQQEAIETTARNEAAAQSEMWKEIHKNDAASAFAAQDNINLLDKFNESYNRLGKYEKGPGLGSLPATSTAAQDTDAAANAIADAVARAQQKGHITVTDRQTYSSMKPGRHMTDDAKNHQVEFIQGMNERIGELPAFDIKAQELGLNPQQRNAVWAYYIKNRPFYNSKEHIKDDENLNTWEDFLTPKKINEALSPKLRQKSPQQKKEIRMFNIISPDGKVVARGTEEQTVKFLKDHRGYSRRAI